MKKILLCACVLLSVFSYSQKKYDCIVITKYEGDNIDSLKTHRFLGYLKSIDDSVVYLSTKREDSLFNWHDIKVVKFRKHNGFMRTVLPLALLTSFVTVETWLYYEPPASTVSYLIPFITVLGTGAYTVFFTLPAGTIIYFITRNHNFPVNSYGDFLRLKQKSVKYILK